MRRCAYSIACEGCWTVHDIGPWPLDDGRQRSFARNPRL